MPQVSPRYVLKQELRDTFLIDPHFFLLHRCYSGLFLFPDCLIAFILSDWMKSDHEPAENIWLIQRNM